MKLILMEVINHIQYIDIHDTHTHTSHNFPNIEIDLRTTLHLKSNENEESGTQKIILNINKKLIYASRSFWYTKYL